MHRHPGEGPAQLLGGAPGPDHAGAQGAAGAVRALELRRHRTAPAAGRRRAGGGQRQRPGAARAAGGLATGLAGQRGQVAPARHLDQHGAPLEPGLGGAPGRRGQVGHRGRAVPVDVGALTGHEHPGGGAADGCRGGDDRVHLAGLHPALDRGGAGEAAAQQGGALGAGPQRQHLAHVRVRRPWLGQQVVTVVPPGHQAQVAHRGEHRGPGADHAADVAAQQLQPGRVARLRPLAGGQPDVLAGAQESLQGGVDPVDVTVVRHDEHGAAPGGQGRAGGHRQRGRPVGGRRRPRRQPARRPGRPARRPSGGRRARIGPDARRSRTGVAHPRVLAGQRQPRGGRGLPGGDPPQERRAGRVAGPGARLGHRRRLGCLAAQVLLRGRVTRGDRQPQHVAQGAGVALGDGPAQRQQRGREHRLRAHHPPQRGQPALVLGLGAALQDEAVDVLPGEPHPHPRTRDRGVGERLGHGVLERAVEVGQPDVDEDDGHGVDRGQVGGGRRAAHAPGGGAHERELLTRAGTRAAHAPRSISSH